MRVILPSRRATDADATKSARLLLADHGALAGYPGPVAILRRDGAVLAANQAADAISERLGLGPDNDLHPDIARAVRGGVATEETVFNQMKAARENLEEVIPTSFETEIKRIQEKVFVKFGPQ